MLVYHAGNGGSILICFERSHSSKHKHQYTCLLQEISTIYYGSKDLSTDIQNWHDYIAFQLPIQQHKVN
jgi:hypothetical protein